MNTTLLIMAAGIGSRFGTGIKQLELVDASNHIIMDYSIHDAIEAGFNHVVFIIRKDIEKEFKEVIGDRIAAICSARNVTVDYAFQDIKDIPGTLPEGRTKPWGTGQAVLAAKKVIKTPFIVINADDYYGKEGFKTVHEYLMNGGKSCMAGFVLKNTLHTDGQAQGYSPPSVPYESPDFGTQDHHWFWHLNISADALFLLTENAHSWHISARPAVFYVFPE